MEDLAMAVTALDLDERARLVELSAEAKNIQSVRFYFHFPNVLIVIIT